MPEIRVLHVITSLAVGGAEQQLVNLVRASNKRGLHHTVCQLGPPEDMVPALHEVGCEVIRLSDRRRRRYVLAYRGLAATIARVRPDIIHSWLFHARFATFLARPRRGPAQVVSLLGTDYDPDSIVRTGLSPSRMAVQRMVDRAMAARAASYVADSNAVKECYVRYVKIPPDRITVIPDSIDPTRVRLDLPAGRALRRTLGIPETGFLFLNVSRLVPGKGHLELIRAFERLARDDPDVWLVLAGDGPLRTPLSSVATDLQAARRIQLLGTVAAVGELLSAADAFVFPSHSEGFSLALAEAMSLGLPSVAADIPVTRELTGDPPAALLTPPGDVDALAAALAGLRSDPELAGSLGHRAKQLAGTQYTIERLEPLWAAVYQAAQAAGQAP